MRKLSRTLALVLLVLAGSAGAAAARPLDDLFDKLPSGAVLAMAIDFSALRSSRHFDAAVALLEEIGESGAVSPNASSGLNPRSDVDELALVVLPDGGRVAALRGANLSEATVRAFYEKSLGKGFREETVGKRRMMTVHDGNHAAFLGERVALVGTKKALRSALDVSSGKKKAVNRTGILKERIARADRESPVWLAGAVTERQRELLKKRGKSDLGTVTGFVGHGSLDSGLRFLMRADCTTADGCQALEGRLVRAMDKVRGTTALKLLGVGAYLDKVKLDRDSQRLTVDVALSDAQAGALLAVGGKVFRALR